MRRWHDKNFIANHFVEWQGHGVKSVKNGFARAVEVAKLDLSDGNVTPHTLRHTAATWLMQLGTDPWESGWLSRHVGEGSDRHLRSSPSRLHEGGVRGDHSQEGDDQARRRHHPDYQASRPHSQHSSNLGREDCRSTSEKCHKQQ
jgi:integrase